MWKGIYVGNSFNTNSNILTKSSRQIEKHLSTNDMVFFYSL